LAASELPPVVDAAWLQAHLGEPDLFVGDVRGPNAHMRGHIPGSKPLVLGSPPPATDADALRELAKEVALRLRRHGLSGEERLVLVDRGDGMGAMPAAQMAELAGHPSVSVLVGGIAAWPGELETGAVALEKTKATFEPRLDAVPTRAELASRLDDPELTLLDVRTPAEYGGHGGYPCDPRQGHVPGARPLPVEQLFAGTGIPLPADDVRGLVGAPQGAEVVAYCHSGSRSALATLALRAAGYRARNYPGSWHEWSRHPELPAERDDEGGSVFKRLLRR
jgi:thiosulfate/3-mercaptopyruvate sulfurtransferase